MSCLSEDVVISFASGQIRGDSLGSIEAHLDGCRPCRRLVSLYAAQTGDAQNNRDSLSAFGQGDVLAERYEIVSLIGQGGMGEVYAARDRVLGETVALKTIAVGAEGVGDLVTRLKAEVQLARRVTHRNVCRVFDVGFHGGDGKAAAPIPFFTMELLQGETLRRRLRRRGPLSASEVMLLLEQMAQALDAAHEAGVLHTDLKSDNVMLVADPGGIRVVIMDFGLARMIDGRTSGGPDDEHAVVGTLGYMAPEQLAGRPSGPATDIYALGVVLFEALTGRLPFVRSNRAPTPDQWRRELTVSVLPAGWEEPLVRCLDPSPAARFSKASLLHAALIAGVRARPEIAARPRGRRQVFTVAVVTATIICAVGIGTASVRLAHPDADRRANASREAAESKPRREAVAVRAAPDPSPQTDQRPNTPVSTENARAGSGVAPSSIQHRPSPKPIRLHPSARPVDQREATPTTAPAEDDDFIDPFREP